MLFKGPGSFKINFKIGGNVDELKAYRLIPLTPPLLFSFYTTFNPSISPRIFVKIEMAQIGNSGARGKPSHEKNLKFVSDFL
jgi:hypothetical protein